MPGRRHIEYGKLDGKPFRHGFFFRQKLLQINVVQSFPEPQADDLPDRPDAAGAQMAAICLAVKMIAGIFERDPFEHAQNTSDGNVRRRLGEGKPALSTAGAFDKARTPQPQQNLLDIVLWQMLSGRDTRNGKRPPFRLPGQKQEAS